MSATLATPVASLHSVDAVADTARVWVDSPTPDRAALKVAAKVAARALHTIVGKPLTVTPDGNGAAYVTYPAIRTRRVAAPAAAPAPAPAPSAHERLLALLDDDGRELLTEVLADRAGLPRKAAPAAAPAPARELPDFIKRAQAVTCHTCRDHGHVRGVGARAGQPYRTADGAKAAKAAGRAVKCPSHKRASKSA